MKEKRIIDYNKILPIIEIYPCLQGEGKYEGRPVIAIRTTGCTHRCYFNSGGWCDTQVYMRLKVDIPLMILLK